MVRDPDPPRQAHGIDEHVRSRPRRDRGRETFPDLDRQLDDACVAEPSGDGQQLEVEGETVLLEDREQFGDDLPPGQLDPALGVGDVQAEQQPSEDLVAPGVEVPEPWVDDHGPGMSLAPDREVGPLGLDATDELTQHRGGDVPIAVDEAEIGAPAKPEAHTQRMALALVDRQVDDLNLRAELCEADITSVSRAVRNRYDLEADPAITQQFDHLRDVTGQVRTRVVVRDDHCQIELASRLHRAVSHCRGRVPNAGADSA